MRLLCGLLIALTPGLAAADTLLLTNGRVITADRIWFEGSQVRYEKDGGVFGLPRALVERVQASPAPPAPVDPDLLRAGERARAGDDAGAALILRQLLVRDARSGPAWRQLAQACLRLGDAYGAREAAQRALQLDGRDAEARAILGDAALALGDRAAALEQYRQSLAARPDAAVRTRLLQLQGAQAPPPSPFRLRYDGPVNEALGVSILRELEAAFREYHQRLDFAPDDPVTVVLLMSQDTAAPEWAEGVNDGTIRIPVMGLTHPTPRLVEVLRHELAHSFIAARTGGNCPTWLQEGVSQWLAGGDPEREDGTVAQAERQRTLLPLLTLEAPFVMLPASEVPLAYAESLSAVVHIVRLRGEAGVVRLLTALGDRLPSDEALPVALALSYPEFQRSWQAHLRGVGARAERR